MSPNTMLFLLLFLLLSPVMLCLEMLQRKHYKTAALDPCSSSSCPRVCTALLSSRQLGRLRGRGNNKEGGRQHRQGEEQVGRSVEGGYARMMMNSEHMRVRMMGEYAGVRLKGEYVGVRMGNNTGGRRGEESWVRVLRKRRRGKRRLKRSSARTIVSLNTKYKKNHKYKKCHKYAVFRVSLMLHSSSSPTANLSNFP